jgi:hypothetical protein
LFNETSINGIMRINPINTMKMKSIIFFLLIINFAGMTENSYSQEKLKNNDLTKAESGDPAKHDDGRYGTAIFAGGCFWGVFFCKNPRV